MSSPLFALAFLLPACGDKDDGPTESSVGDSQILDSGDSGDSGDTDDSDVETDVTCEFVGMDRLVFDRAGGDEVGVTLECDDATLVGTPVFEIVELGITMDLTGEAQSNGTTWKGKGKSLSELEELVAEKGLSYGMDVSKYNLDEDKVAPPTDNLGAGVRFHDDRTRFGGVTNTPPQGHSFKIRDEMEVVVLEVDKENRSLVFDSDGDGGPETYDIRSLSFSPDDGTVGLGSCVVGDDSDCTLDALFDGLPTDLGESTHAVYGGVPAWQHSTLDVTRAEGKGSVTFGLAVPGSESSRVYLVSGDQTGSSSGSEWTLDYAELSLATSGSSSADPTSAPLVLGLSQSDDADGRESSGTLTAAGVGTHEKDGSTVFWGATWKDSTTLASSWTSSTEWTTVYPEASVMVTTKRGSELVVFGGTGDLMARSFDPATGKEYSEVEFEGVEDVLAISTTTSDLNGDGNEELLVAAVDADGALQFLVGHFSSEGGLQKIAQHTPAGLVGRWRFDDAHGLDSSGHMNHGSITVGADSAGNVAVVVSQLAQGRHATWATTWMGEGTGSSFLDEAPDHDELIALDTTGVIFEPGADTCTPDKESDSKQTGFCGRVFSERLRHKSRAINIRDYERLVGDQDAVELTSLDWRGEDPRGIPLVDTADFVVAAIDGQVQVFGREGKELGEGLDLDAAGSLSAAQVDDTLVLFGSGTDGSMVLATVKSDGTQGVGTVDSGDLKTGDDFQIPEKVVMEKEDDFYGRVGSTPSGMTVSFTTYTDEDGDGTVETVSFDVARVAVDELPTKGESTLTLSDVGRIGGGEFDGEGGIYGSVEHPMATFGLSSLAVMVRRGANSRRPLTPGSEAGSQYLDLADMTGVESLQPLTTTAETDDLVAVVPWDTGTNCAFATVFVPGTSQDWSTNAAGAVVLATAEEADCSDLAVPVGAIDVAGEGLAWPVLARVDATAGTTTFGEVVWDGTSLLQLPGVVIEATEIDGVDIGDFDGDGTDDLALRFYRLRRDNVMNRLGRERVVVMGRATSLAPLDNEGADFSKERTIYYADLDDGAAELNEDVQVLDSQDAGLTELGEPWFILVGGLEGQETLGNCQNANSALAGCGWDRDEGDTDLSSYRSAWNGGVRTTGAYSYSFWIRPE